MGALDLERTRIFNASTAQHLNDGARARVDVVLRSIVALCARLHCWGSSIPLLISTLKPHFTVNDLQHTKTPKLTKKIENNKAKSLTNIS